jgi:hypothetical protein
VVGDDAAFFYYDPPAFEVVFAAADWATWRSTTFNGLAGNFNHVDAQL